MFTPANKFLRLDEVMAPICTKALVVPSCVATTCANMDWNVALETVATDRPESVWTTDTVETMARVVGTKVGAIVATVGTMVGVLVVSDTAGFTRTTG